MLSQRIRVWWIIFPEGDSGNKLLFQVNPQINWNRSKSNQTDEFVMLKILVSVCSIQLGPEVWKILIFMRSKATGYWLWKISGIWNHQKNWNTMIKERINGGHMLQHHVARYVDTYPGATEGGGVCRSGGCCYGNQDMLTSYETKHSNLNLTCATL